MKTDAYSNSMLNQYNSKRHDVGNCSMQMTIQGDHFTGPTRLLICNLKPTLIAIQCRHLNINNNQSMTMGMLIKILRLFPNLESLKLSSLEEPTNCVPLSTMNKVTKVKLEQVANKQHIQFLINLCPRIQYLEIGCLTNTDLRMLVKSIMSNQMARIPNLCSVCFNVSNANESMIPNLKRAIDYDTIIESYTVQRIADKIFIKWQLP